MEKYECNNSPLGMIQPTKKKISFFKSLFLLFLISGNCLTKESVFTNNNKKGKNEIEGRDF